MGMAHGCVPTLSDIADGTNQTDNQAKVAELNKLALGKDIKMLFTIDTGDSTELENSIFEMFPADGYVLLNADGLTVDMNFTASDRSFFIEANDDIPDGAFYYKI